MKLSENLSLKEVTKSNTATYHGIDNNPNEEQLSCLKSIAKNVFQPIRNELGKIIVSSGLRSEELNKILKGSKTSQHCEGKALDLDNDGDEELATNSEIFHFIKDNLEFDQLIWEFGTDKNPDWVHVSYQPGGMNRKDVRRAIKEDGRTKYPHYK
jgi:hypothetical protein